MCPSLLLLYTLSTGFGVWLHQTLLDVELIEAVGNLDCVRNNRHDLVWSVVKAALLREAYCAMTGSCTASCNI